LLDRIASFSSSYPQRLLGIFLFDPQARRMRGRRTALSPAFLANWAWMCKTLTRHRSGTA
jgi:hypothetical protein